MYTTKDVELIKTNIDDTIEKIEIDKLNIYEPTRDQQMQAINIVLQYVKDNKRKVYGGFSQNKLVMKKDPKDGFYPEYNIPDIDFYSPEPLQDVKAICDLLYAAKIGENVIEGKQAFHNETYKIHANFEDVCDISYVPKFIYHKIKTIEIDGIHYVNPCFIFIDLYRVLTDPHFSSRTWGKHFGRLQLLQKHYPFKHYNDKLNDAYNIPKDVAPEILKINKFIMDDIKNKTSYIITGQLAYNYFLDESQIMKTNKIYEFIDMPLIQIISTNYIHDAAILLHKLREFNIDIKFIEHYPFFQFTGYNVIAYYKDIPILHITSHNDRCTPIRKVSFKTFYEGKIDVDKKDFIQLGSFDVVFLMNLIGAFRCDINDVNDKLLYHNIMTSHLIDMRNYYFEKNKKNLLDNTLFQSFVPTCIGDSYDPLKQTIKERRQKILDKKRPIYKYTPESGADIPDFKFCNTSGNPIIKSQNFKVTKYALNPELLGSK